jgi:hypothetical protein
MSAESSVFTGSIENVYTANSIPESLRRFRFKWPILDPSVPPTHIILGDAWYTNTSLNDDGDTADAINPFDLLSPVHSPLFNGLVDGKLIQLERTERYDLTTMHEFGHAVGISRKAIEDIDGTVIEPKSCQQLPGYEPNDWDDQCHPTKGNSIMMLGFMVQQNTTFSHTDIEQMRLKFR